MQIRSLIRAVLALLVLLTALPAAARGQEPVEILPLEEFSPGFLGMYRKVMLIESEIRQHTERYGVDFDLARAICLYESGGNAGLTSGAGARGYFQVMPATYRELGVSSNIEAGIKYLSQMLERFGREDRAVAAYNGGPARVGRAGNLPLETLQYVLGVGHYRTVLKLYEPSLRFHASNLRIAAVQAGDDWTILAERLGVAAWELRLHNPFLSERPLRQGQLVAYPPEPRQDLFREVEGHAEYRMRHGDNYLKLALTLGIDPDALRDANSLWQLQSVPAGVTLRIPLAADRSAVVHTALGLTPPDVPLPAAASADTDRIVRAVVESPAVEPAEPEVRDVVHRVARGDTLTGLAQQYGTTIRWIQQANGMGRRTSIRVGERLTIPAGRAGAAPPPQPISHRVRRGDTLTDLARRYGTTISAIQRANGMGRRTTIRVGETLRIPATASSRAAE